MAAVPGFFEEVVQNASVRRKSRKFDNCRGMCIISVSKTNAAHRAGFMLRRKGYFDMGVWTK